MEKRYGTWIELQMMWSWILAAIGVTGIFFVGRKTVWGWLVLLVNEGLWTVYAIQTHQYGFILMSTAYSVIYIKSYLKWKEEEAKGVWI